MRRFLLQAVGLAAIGTVADVVPLIDENRILVREGLKALLHSPTVGVAALLLTIFTDHQTGLVPVLPYNVHLAVDLAVGLLFLVLPLALGFAGLDAAYYWLNGIAVVAVIGLSKPENDMASA